MDIALAIEHMLYGAKYSGSVTANTQEQYDELDWQDERIQKPKWEDLLNAWNEIKDVQPPKSEMELLQDKIIELENRIKTLEGN
jgi:hypothetical protein